MILLEGVGHPTNCVKPVAIRGRFKAGDRKYRVDVCEGHAGDLGAPLLFGSVHGSVSSRFRRRVASVARGNRGAEDWPGDDAAHLVTTDCTSWFSTDAAKPVTSGFALQIALGGEDSNSRQPRPVTRHPIQSVRKSPSNRP